MKHNSRKSVLVIGGGYGGLKACQWLANKPLSVKLIDQNKYHYLQTEAYEFIANTSDISDIAISLDAFVGGLGENISFIHDKALYIDASNKEVTLANQKISYDYLIIATGALTYFPKQINGIMEHCNGVKTLLRALEFKQKFENTIFDFLKQSLENQTMQYTIIIGGAGLSGVEIAAEMGYIVRQYMQAIGFSNHDIQIILVEGSGNILPGIDETIVAIAKKRLESLGVIVKTNCMIKEIQKEKIYFANQESLQYNFMIFTGGIDARPIEGNFIAKFNERNQYCVDSYFRVNAQDNIFAIGDVANIFVRDTILPSTAQSAEQAGIFCAKNILRDINGKKMKRYEPKVYGMFIALGGKYGVGILLTKAIIKGYKAYVLKKFIGLFYKWVLKRKLAQ